jgi:AhpD family alkylhydroperoxidase
MGRRLVVRGLEAMCTVMWGFPPTIIALIVDHMGTAGAIRWFVANMPRYLVSTAVLGPIRAHLACVVTALRNGCIYCAHGHVYALELLDVRDHGRLFPIDANALDEWFGLDARALRRKLHAALAEAGLHTEVVWADRIVALADGSQQPVDGDEARIVHLMRMSDTMNEIAVSARIRPEEAQDPVNKNAALKARHAALRAAAAM